MRKVIMMGLILVAGLLFAYGGQQEKDQLAFYNNQYQTIINTHK